MKKTKLSVCIPTYNRVSSLEQILIQLKKENSREIEIIICDDHSSDNTKEMVKRYTKTIHNLRYFYNSKNLGYSGNVLKTYSLAQSEYVWFLCDDDTIVQGAINKIISTIKKYQPSVALFNCTWVNPFGQKEIAGVAKNKFYTNISDFDEYNTLMRLTFLSIIVARKSQKCLKRVQQINYQENIFVQISLCLCLLSADFKLCEIGEVILHRNVGYKYGEFFKFYLIDHLKAVFIIDHKFNNQKFLSWSYKHLLVSLKLYLSQKLGLFSYTGTPTKKTKIAIKEYYKSLSYIIFLFPLIKTLTPTIFLKLYYLLTLISIHGFHKGWLLYKENINRSFKDIRLTGFTSYR